MAFWALGLFANFGISNTFDLSQAFCESSATHLLGCDAYGNDLGWRTAFGVFHSLKISTMTVTCTSLLGLIIGTGITFAPKPLASICLRLIDCFLAFPGLLLAILIAALMPPSPYTVVFSLVIMGWASHARLVRVLLLQTLKQPYVEAARATGASPLRILIREVYPALWGQLLVQATLGLSSVILAEASLSFLGLGGPIGQPSLGALIAEGREYLVESPHVAIVPGCALLLLVLMFQILSRPLSKRTTHS